MKKILLALALLATTLTVVAQRVEHSAEFFFEQGAMEVDSSLRSNGQTITELQTLLSRLSNDPQVTILSIDIDSYSSPEGDKRLNERLSEQRSQHTFELIQEICPLPDSLFHTESSSIPWELLTDMVAASDTPYAAEVIRIIETQEEETFRRLDPTDRWMTLVDSRNKHLMELRCGVPYRYMMEHLFPSLRTSSVVVVAFRVEAQPIISESLVLPTTTPQHQELAQPEKAEPTTAIEAPTAPKAAKEPIKLIPPPVALKSNLLFDAATLINAEVEVPIGERWSVAAEWIFPWWTNDDGTADSKRNRTQMLSGNLEAKYWFGDRTSRPLMTGWFASLYAGGGLYDFERNAKGYQGEFFIAAGVSAGYAHTINTSGSLRMEYSVGVGYLETEYRYYEAEYYSSSWHPFRDYTGNYTWIGPTKARVSLVWLFDWNKNKKGGQR